MSTIDALVENVTADLKANIPNVKSVESFGGRFDLAALQTFGANAPGIRVSAIEISKTSTSNTGQLDCEVKMMAVVVTRDEKDKPRDKTAALIVSQIMARAHLATWGMSGVHPGRSIAAQNLYSGKIQSAGTALWGVTWISKLRIGVDCNADPAPAEGEPAPGLVSLWVNDELVHPAEAEAP